MEAWAVDAFDGLGASAEEHVQPHVVILECHTCRVLVDYAAVLPNRGNAEDEPGPTAGPMAIVLGLVPLALRPVEEVADDVRLGRWEELEVVYQPKVSKAET